MSARPKETIHVSVITQPDRGRGRRRRDMATDARATLHPFVEMYSYEKRLQTFAEWPFREDCLCTPEQMTKAGFVHCPSENEPDVVCCFFCLKELEGWEPEDNPWLEHIKRSPNCGFLTLNKDFYELTVVEFFKLEQERLTNVFKKAYHQMMARFRDEVELTLKNLNILFSSKS
ncbi:baculoviral IAP repeat-containing protein 5.1-like [Arapaima gigas]